MELFSTSLFPFLSSCLRAPDVLCLPPSSDPEIVELERCPAQLKSYYCSSVTRPNLIAVHAQK